MIVDSILKSKPISEDDSDSNFDAQTHDGGMDDRDSDDEGRRLFLVDDEEADETGLGGRGRRGRGGGVVVSEDHISIGKGKEGGGGGAVDDDADSITVGHALPWSAAREEGAKDAEAPHAYPPSGDGDGDDEKFLPSKKRRSIWPRPLGAYVPQDFLPHQDDHHQQQQQQQHRQHQIV
jgi:hypothetical protein